MWKFDPGSSSAVLVRSLDLSFTSTPSQPMTVMGDSAYLIVGNDKEGWRLWKSDGTESGTTLVKRFDEDSSSYQNELTTANGLLFFKDLQPTAVSLWASDGTPDGTVIVSAESNEFSVAGPGNLTVAGNDVYFMDLAHPYPFDPESSGRLIGPWGDLWKVEVGDLPRSEPIDLSTLDPKPVHNDIFDFPPMSGEILSARPSVVALTDPGVALS
jgi:ELWxxDGT repeat protein